MKVGIYSNNAQVNAAIVSMCANNGCKIQKLLKYNRFDFKGCDMVIIDLDNCTDGKQFLEKDVPEMPEIVFLGISKELDIIDNFRGIMNVEKKPFLDKIFKHYQQFVLDRLESMNVVTKEENRIYDEFGINLAATFNDSNIATEERLNTLKKVIKEKSTYDSEEVFLKKIGLDRIEHIEGKKIPLEPIDIQKEITVDPIVKYRIRKLKMMNLSNKDIDDRINEIINANVQMAIGRPKINSQEQDILTKLRKQGQAGIKNKFQQMKNEETQKSVNEDVKSTEPPTKKEQKAEVVEPDKKQIQDDVKPAPEKKILQKPLIGNDGPPIKPEKERTLQKPIMFLENNQHKNDSISKPETKKAAVLSRPRLTMEDDGPKQEPIKNEEVIPNKIETDIANDPLLRRRAMIEKEKQESSETITNKALQTNKNDETLIKGNNDSGFGESLKDRMKARIGYEMENREERKQSAYEIASKKMKPPR